MKENVARKLQDSGSYDIWRKLGLWTSFSKRLTWCAVVFAFLAGLAGLLKTVEEIAQVANVLSIVLAFLAALAGLAAKLADKRKQALEEAHMRTCPEMEVAIKTSSNSGRFLVVVEPHNNVPFEYDWKIVTRNNLIISGMHLQWGRVDPNPQTPVFTERADFDVSRVVDDYIGLAPGPRTPEH
jgi:nitrate reductase NapAB chaperone NapD